MEHRQCEKYSGKLCEKDVTLKLLDEIKTEKYEAYISEIVVLEISRAPAEIAMKLREVINSVNLIELPVDENSQLLAKKYIEQGIIPAKYEDDALHIAIASVNNLDVIVSWNYKHIVKLKTKKEVTGINALLGYKEIEIYSPLEVIEDV